MDLPYEARIEVTYEADGALAQAIEEHKAWIMGEVLAVRLAPGSPAGALAEAGAVHDFDIEGMAVRVGIRRSGH